MTYINIFNGYELAFCYDNELYYQNFNVINNFEVTNNIKLYVMFDILLREFKEHSQSICYGLLEYFINSGDISRNYFSISTDLLDFLQYVYCDDTRFDKSLNTVTVEQINSGIIDPSNPIFISTQRYFNSLYSKINAKTLEIYAYLDGTNQNPDIEKYIKRNLNMYGFMNMTNDYFDSFLSQPDVASGIIQTSTFPFTAQERQQQIESQKLRQTSIKGKPQIMPRKKITTIFDLPKNESKYLAQDTPQYVTSTIGKRGGKFRSKKKHNKNKKTHKNIKFYKKNKTFKRSKRSKRSIRH